jgi:hypothetical protein
MKSIEYILNKFNITSLVDEKDKPIRQIRLENFTRNDLARLFAELEFKRGVEVGVERGLYSKVLLESNKDLYLYCVDPLLVYSGYREHVTQSKMDEFHFEVYDRLDQAGGSPRRFSFYRDFSMEVVHDFADNSIDFVYIDGNHDFKHTTEDIAEWGKKVKKGGIVAGHDFNRNKKKDYHCHVKDVVQGWTYAYDIKPYFVTSDKSPSWFWVK